MCTLFVYIADVNLVRVLAPKQTFFARAYRNRNVFRRESIINIYIYIFYILYINIYIHVKGKRMEDN